MKAKFKIAFHLARGVNYMHWQIKDNEGNVVYVDPNKNDIVLYNCKLKNQKSASMRIFKGADKLRCAWVEFDSYEITPLRNYTSNVHVRFNPRVSPTWLVNDVDNQDDKTFDVLKTNNNQLFA